MLPHFLASKLKLVNTQVCTRKSRQEATTFLLGWESSKIWEFETYKYSLHALHNLSHRLHNLLAQKLITTIRTATATSSMKYTT